MDGGWGGDFGVEGLGETGLPVMVNGGEGAEDEAGDVGEGLGAADGDAIAGEEFVEVGEGMVDALSGLETVGVAEEELGEVGVLGGSHPLGKVPGTKARGERAKQTILTSTGRETLAAARLNVGAKAPPPDI